MTSLLPLRGVLLAGGHGTRLHPLTAAGSKQLLPVFDKPMIYYPLSTLIRAGVRDVLLISAPEERARFERQVGDGSAWGISITHATQAAPEGIAQALLIGQTFLEGHRCLLVLGDNILHGADEALARAVVATPSDGATIFAHRVENPSRYGVVTLDDAGRPLAVEEKPPTPSSPYAIPGIYVLGTCAPARAAALTPSARGELEITDLHGAYLAEGRLRVERLGSQAAWFDAGTPEALLDAALFVQALAHRGGGAVGAPEAAAWRAGLLPEDALRARIEALPPGAYRAGLARLLPR